MNKQNLIILILGISLIITVNFLILDKWLDSRVNELSAIYQQGYDDGLGESVTTIFTQTEDCQVTTIWVGNFSKAIIDFACR